jgi:hypothetical protein
VALTSPITKIAADTYATRAVLIELLRTLNRTNPGTADALRATLMTPAHLKPEDVVMVSEQDTRDRVELLFREVATER